MVGAEDGGASTWHAENTGNLSEGSGRDLCEVILF